MMIFLDQSGLSILTFCVILIFVRLCCWEGYTIETWSIWLDIVQKRVNICLFMFTWVKATWLPTCTVS